MSFVNQTGKTNGLVFILKKMVKFRLGNEGGRNFVGFSKFSLEIFNYFFV